MMFKSKYIVVARARVITPIVFSETMGHNEMAAAVRGEVLGAGFCHINENQYTCHGESVSLKIKSRGEVDSNILNLYLGTKER